VSSSERGQKFFDAIARRYDRVYAPSSTESRARMQRVLAALPPASQILDLGVGTGRELSSLLDAGHTVVGLDFSPEMLAVCARRARRISVVQGDFWDRLPFSDAAFDVVLALHGTLAHPPSQDACGEVAVEVARVLRSGGVFVAEVPLPKWLDAARRSAGEGKVQRVGERGALIEDGVTGASILALILSVEDWQDALSPLFDAEMMGADGEELFFAATKR
jgi:ubiquinone/menaquinone biosynthesis C-methylase UbiE